jgi:hypothetical protein
MTITFFLSTNVKFRKGIKLRGDKRKGIKGLSQTIEVDSRGLLVARRGESRGLSIEVELKTIIPPLPKENTILEVGRRLQRRHGAWRPQIVITPCS